MKQVGCIRLCAPAQTQEDIIKSLEQELTAAGIAMEGSEVAGVLMGNVILCGPEEDAEWLTGWIDRSRSLGIRSLVLWRAEAPPSRLSCWQWLLAGADYIIHRRQEEQGSETLVSRLKRWAYVESHVSDPELRLTLAGESAAWRGALRQVIEIALFSHSPVLILGESGTGKEMVARLIHKLDKRPGKQEMTLLDCSAIVPELSGSEFFGHEKGAFTNAVQAREGAFATADKGTLFLDEIGELPVHLQAELLRVVQEGTYKRVGSNQWKKTEFRLVSATNRDLEKGIQEKSFRPDLYYRLSTWVVSLPALRDRVEDIPVLANAFLEQLMPDHRSRPTFDPMLMGYLCTRDYPGNVRELRQVVTRLTNRYTGHGLITLGDLPPTDRSQAPFPLPAMSHPRFVQFVRAAIQEGHGLRNLLHEFSELAKMIAIEETRGNLQAASTLLQVTDRTLQMHCSKRPNGYDLP